MIRRLCLTVSEVLYFSELSIVNILLFLSPGITFINKNIFLLLLIKKE
jgi:hypothetical protein